MEVLSPWALGSRGHSGGGHWILHHCKTSRLSSGLRVDGIGRIYGRSEEINQAICLHAKIKMNLTCHVGKANNRATPNWSAIHGLKHYLNINRFTHNVKHIVNSNQHISTPLSFFSMTIITIRGVSRVLPTGPLGHFTILRLFFNLSSQYLSNSTQFYNFCISGEH